MRYELWFSKSESSGLLLAEGDRAWDHLKAVDSTMIWTCQADSYQEARQERDEFCQRSGFQILGMRDPTTRVIWAFYEDESGEQKVEIPGWGPSLPQLARYLAEHQIEPRALLGQIFVERPYRELADAPTMLTVADLVSSDGTRRMVQEFAGEIEDQLLILSLITRRLGPDMRNWEIKNVHRFRR